ncbi:helix-turn-helix domain-containing protein [Streptomyces alkaliphilus]|uniref:Helix-turn-helix domain-containing protein n=2 Tax=Streptomyces alkaliphilus TaxID=1472722 RepID=A0A7W3TGF0_9ACTN|nr:helix-turn-helix domain-containing protein [Streptomyces alkaliphilus]
MCFRTQRETRCNLQPSTGESMTESNFSVRRAHARRLVAESLKAHRARAGLTLRDLAKELNFSHGYIARVETSAQMPSESLAQTLDGYFKTNGLFAGLLVLTSHDGTPDYISAALQKERTAVRIQVLVSNVLPGLLQTPDYSRALFTSAAPKSQPEQFDEAVNFRQQRVQTVLKRDKPALYWAILDEAALARPLGGKSVMRKALKHMRAMTERQNIVVQVIPFAAGGHSMLSGSFTALTAPNGSCAAYLESFGSGETVEDPERVTELLQRLDHAKSCALPESESLKVIEKYEKEYTE